MQFFEEEPALVALAPRIGIGFSVSQGWLPLVDHPLLILVGLTGVGKSTVTVALSHAGVDFSLLPNH
jgi:Mrp family chromosome partitioning ATPase